MGFQPFKALKTIINGLKQPSSVLQGPTIGGWNKKTIAPNKRGIIHYNPTDMDYSGHVHSGSDKFYVYPLDHKDQEHYILFDIIERIPDKSGVEFNVVQGAGHSKHQDNLSKVVYGTNRFFSEGTGNLIWGMPTGKGNHRVVKHTIAVYMPQTLKFNMHADYGAEEVGFAIGAFAKLKDALAGDKFWGEDIKSIAVASQGLVANIASFASGGLLAGAGAALQRRTGIAPAAMTEMVFNGIDYRTFSFTFKFTPRSKKESDVVNSMLHTIKDAMLPMKFGKGPSVAAYRVPHEFVIRFMKGTNINPYIDQIGLCACTGVDIDYGSDKFSTHVAGDPVSIDATLTFKELELMERSRYNQLRQSASESRT